MDDIVTCECCDSKDIVVEHGVVTCLACGAIDSLISDRRPCSDLVDSCHSGVTDVMFESLSHVRSRDRCRTHMTWSPDMRKDSRIKRHIDEFTSVCTAHNVKVSTIDLGKDILYHFLSESTKRHRGMINGGIYSACLYLAYRNQGQYVSYKHTSAMFLIKKRFSTIGYKELEAVPIVKRLFIDTVDEMTITDCVKKYVIMLGLSEPMQKEVYRIANVIDANDLLETCNTISIVAACIAFKSVEFNLGITHSRIAAFMGLHPVTIENILITLLQNHVDLMI